MKKLIQDAHGSDEKIRTLFTKLFPGFIGVSKSQNSTMTYTKEQRSFFGILLELKIEKQEGILKGIDSIENSGRLSDASERSARGQEQTTKSLEKSRISKHIEQLRAAMANNHGLCVETGNSIYYMRMLLVPHTSSSIEAKKNRD